jgi:hypothetical protein
VEEFCHAANLSPAQFQREPNFALELPDDSKAAGMKIGQLFRAQQAARNEAFSAGRRGLRGCDRV